MGSDRDGVAGGGRDTHAARPDRRRIGDGSCIRGARGSPDAEPGMPGVPGDEEPARRLPAHGVRGVGDAEAIREPDRAQVRLDGELKGQLSRAAGGVPELVLDDESLATVRAELKALDLEAVQHRAVR